MDGVIQISADHRYESVCSNVIIITSSVLPRIEKGHGAAWGKRALLFAKLHFKGTFARVIIF